MVNSRQKGNRGEQQVMSLLGRMTEERWEQVPGSGSGKIKEILEYLVNIIYFA